MKTCTKCKLPKDESDFNKDKYQKSGLSCICRSCAKIKTKIYKKTKGGLIAVIYSNQKSNATKRGRNIPNYTKQELKEWMYSQKIFHELYSNWKSYGYKKDLIPSCDRHNDYMNYTLDNLTIVTWKYNNQKHYQDVIDGNNTKNCQPIIGINLESGERKSYKSIAIASRKLNINASGICNCLRGKTTQSGNYKWEYKIKKKYEK